MNHPYPVWFALVLATLVLPHTAATQDNHLRTIEFETTEVTAADVALSPDGQWLIFTMLGHLFRLPVEGGTAEQLTFGPYYDTDPEVSPDGIHAVFISDRDGSAGNVFVLDLRTREIQQVTHEAWTARPTWRPDGQVIAYLRLARDVPGSVPAPPFSFAVPDTVPSTVHEVSVLGEEPETVSGTPEIISSLFYLSDGRLGWTAVELETGRSSEALQATSRIEVRSTSGAVSTLRTIAGYAGPCVPTAAGDGFYCRRFHPLPRWYTRPVEDLLFAGLDNEPDRVIFRLARPRGWTPRFAVDSDNNLFIEDSGRLWKISGPDAVHEFIPFNARVESEIWDSVAPPEPVFLHGHSPFPPRSVSYPRLSPDGRTLVFEAAGHLWQQPLRGGSATRLFKGDFLEEQPAFSPDGGQLAYIQRQDERHRLVVFDLASGRSRTLFTRGCCWTSQPSWAPDGRRLAFGENAVAVIDVATGAREVLRRLVSDRVARPHFSADSDWIYFSSESDGTGALFRMAATSGRDPEAITRLTRDLNQGLISPDGNWLAFWRNWEIWVAPLNGRPVHDEDTRLLTEGGPTFAFTPDAESLLYTIGNRMWRHSLTTSERVEIPIRLDLERPIPPPLLLRNVRLLDFDAGGFGTTASVYIEQGRIRWIGAEDRHDVPDDVLVVDGGGRFVIPGLFDMHVHGSFANQKAFIAYGVTSVRDLGGWLPTLNALSDRADASNDPVPRYFSTGEHLHGADPGELGSVIFDEATARAEVRRRKDGGAQFIKAHYPLDWPLLRAVVDEAHRQDLPVVGHGFKGIEEIIKCITLGYSSLEHTTTPGRLYDDVLQLLAASSTHWDPTLTTRGSFLAVRDEPERLNDAKLRAFTPQWAIRQAKTLRYFDGLPTVGENEFRGRWSLQLASVRDAHQRGVNLLIGTGAGNPGIFFGSHLHWELEFFVQAGLPPLDVLRIATLEAAHAVGAANHLGTLEPDKLADMVLLDANPLDDIKNTQTIWRVIKGGWVFDPEKLRPTTASE